MHTISLKKTKQNKKKNPEKMLHITYYGRNENRNFNEVSPETSQKAHPQKDHKELFEGRMNTWKCVAESLCCTSETITVLLIGYVPI